MMFPICQRTAYTDFKVNSNIAFYAGKVSKGKLNSNSLYLKIKNVILQNRSNFKWHDNRKNLSHELYQIKNSVATSIYLGVPTVNKNINRLNVSTLPNPSLNSA